MFRRHVNVRKKAFLIGIVERVVIKIHTNKKEILQRNHFQIICRSRQRMLYRQAATVSIFINRFDIVILTVFVPLTL